MYIGYLGFTCILILVVFIELSADDFIFEDLED